jgi:exodeoxyribonuclease V alpha subunit
MTVDRLLGWLPGARYRHDARNPLPHDLVIIDETSMVSLPMMAKLLDAVRPDARLVLVGDPHQLASIEAGTVMDDVVGPAQGPDRAAGGPLAGRVTLLRRMRRFAEDSAIAALAEAVRAGETDTALELLGGGHSDLLWVSDDDRDGLDRALDRLVTAGIEVATAALEGDARRALDAATRIKVLAATRGGPLGLYDWSDRIEAAVAEALPALNRSRRWYVGRPVIVTANDAINGVFNGDVGVVVAHDGELSVDTVVGDGVRALAPSRLDRVETWWAMTIHKSQGSEFLHAVVSLPPAASPILTRELLHTAVTRAKQRLTVVGGEASLRVAIDRPIARASGLRDRLWPWQSDTRCHSDRQ